MANQQVMSDAAMNRGVAAISKRLGVAVSFLRWSEPDRFGAQTPVFAVPANVAGKARALGLTVEIA
jgi:hypothetical protein